MSTLRMMYFLRQLLSLAQARSYIGTRGGGSCPQMDALPGCPHQRPTCNFFYTSRYHHQCH